MSEVFDDALHRYLNDDEEDVRDLFEEADRLRDEHNDRELEKWIEDE